MVTGDEGVRMFEVFTDRGRRVVVLAQETSRQLRHPYIGTGHLLVALTQDQPTGSILSAAGATEVAVTSRLRARRPSGKKDPSGHIPFTSAAKHILETSMREMRRLGHARMGPAHLLLAVLDGEDTLALELLADLGLDQEPGQGRLRRAAERQAALDASDTTGPIHATMTTMLTARLARLTPQPRSARRHAPLRCASPPPHAEHLPEPSWPVALEICETFLASVAEAPERIADLPDELTAHLRWLTGEVRGLLADLERDGYPS